MKKKITITITMLAAILCFAVGGTLAWLVDKTEPVANTFTVSDVTIELKETTGQEYKMVPGTELEKDPTVTVKANSEDCWLFVKVEKSQNLGQFIIYTMAEGWNALSDNKDVFYREVSASTTDQNFAVIGHKGVNGAGEFVENKVLVRDSVTKEKFSADDFTEPTLTFTAYAIQKEGFTDVAAAWAEVSSN